MQMTPDRWKRTEELFHAARARPPGERDAFLTDACAGDAALRREIESLLNEPVSDDEFLGGPVLSAIVLASATAPYDMTGRALGGYVLNL